MLFCKNKTLVLCEFYLINFNLIRFNAIINNEGRYLNVYYTKTKNNNVIKNEKCVIFKYRRCFSNEFTLKTKIIQINTFKYY